MKDVSVIVSNCGKDRALFGARLFDQACVSVEQALTIGKTYAADGKSVIVRPNYNETNDNGVRYFREWRSFNGADFKEVRWTIG